MGAILNVLGGDSERVVLTLFPLDKIQERRLVAKPLTMLTLRSESAVERALS